MLQSGEVSKLRWQSTIKVHASKVQIRQALERAQETRHRQAYATKVVPTKIEMLQVLQSKQRGTYLAEHPVRCYAGEAPNEGLVAQEEGGAEVEPDDMAGLVAAPDAAPAAAVIAAP